jgi:outer membrane lipoprotein LolB
MKNSFLVLMLVLLIGCQPEVKPVSDVNYSQRQIERELALQTQNQWSFRGRVAVSDGQQAGTVKMHWQQRGDQFDIEISLPITNQKYRLRSINKKVQLEGFGIVLLEGDSAEAVLQQVTGWRVPFKDMQLWLRGMRTNSATRVDFAPTGLPAQFRENGWLVDYRAWDSALLPMPIKVFASSSTNGKNASVKLQIEAWEAP